MSDRKKIELPKKPAPKKPASVSSADSPDRPRGTITLREGHTVPTTWT
ncbi:hypothetical protein GCM10010327_56940 [Streptomyces nitrosporeus]|nr:hypothetical protein GCM10010327_56940 [Streptomyces nitrosporeus]